MGSKKKTKSESSSTSQTTPASFVLPGITQAGTMIDQALRANAGATNMTGDVVNAYKTTAADASGFANMLKAQVGDGSQLPSLNGSFANYDAGAIQPVVAASIAPVARSLEQTLAGQQSSAAAAGAYGTSRALTQLPGMAIDSANRNMQEIATQLAFADYNNQQQKALALPGYLSSIAGLDANAADVLGAANQYQFNAPYLGLTTAVPLLAQLGQGYGQTNSSSKSKTVESTGGLGSVVQGLAGVAGMAAGIPGIGSGISGLFSAASPAAGAGGFNILGSGAGALLGGG